MSHQSIIQMGLKLHVVFYDTLEKDFFQASLFQKSNEPHTTRQQTYPNSLPFFERANAFPMCPVWCTEKMSDAYVLIISTQCHTSHRSCRNTEEVCRCNGVLYTAGTEATLIPPRLQHTTILLKPK